MLQNQNAPVRSMLPAASDTLATVNCIMPKLYEPIGQYIRVERVQLAGTGMGAENGVTVSACAVVWCAVCVRVCEFR